MKWNFSVVKEIEILHQIDANPAGEKIIIYPVKIFKPDFFKVANRFEKYGPPSCTTEPCCLQSQPYEHLIVAQFFYIIYNRDHKRDIFSIYSLKNKRTAKGLR